MDNLIKQNSLLTQFQSVMKWMWSTMIKHTQTVCLKLALIFIYKDNRNYFSLFKILCFVNGTWFLRSCFLTVAISFLHASLEQKNTIRKSIGRGPKAPSRRHEVVLRESLIILTYVERQILPSMVLHDLGCWQLSPCEDGGWPKRMN